MNNKLNYFLILLCILNIFIFIDCISVGLEPGPYDPKKAGAEIIDSYDISNIITESKYKNIQFTEYDSKFYILHNNIINIYNKENMIKINEIVFSIADLYPEYNSYLNDRYYNNNIAVFDNKILLSYTLTIKNLNYINKRTLYDMDLSGDNFRELDISSDFGLVEFPFHLGFDRGTENIWLLSDGKINNFKYLPDKTYQKISDWNYTPLWYSDNLCLYDSKVWIDTGSSFELGDWVYLEMRDINNLSKILKKIDVFYLSALYSPKSIHYDGEYLWVIIEKDSKMQLLKLGMDLIK